MKKNHFFLLVIIITSGLLIGQTSSIKKSKNVETLIEENCTRDTASSILIPEYFPNAIFELQEDRFTGIETFFLKNGDKIIIKNWGCEYYVLTFRMESSTFQSDTSNLANFGIELKKLFSDIYPGLNAPIDIKNANSKLREHLMNFPDYQFGDPIYFMDGEIPEFVSLNKIEELKSGLVVVEVTYSAGPL